MKIEPWLLLLSCLFITSSAGAETCDVNTYYSPTEKIAPIIIQELQGATQTIQASLFGLTNDELADTLITLSKAGIKVEVAVDKRQAKVLGSDIKKLTDAGIPVYIKKTGILEHNKYVIIDGKVLILGSFNWSHGAQAQDNSDAVLKNCPENVLKAQTDWQRIKTRDMK
jgi:cardiolipin hydrolase